MALLLFANGACTSSFDNSDAALNRATSRKVIRFVNQERARRNLPVLATDRRLAELAEAHVGFLVRSVDPTRGKPSARTAHHGFKPRAARAESAGYRILSEVVMIGYAGDLQAVAERTLQGWLTSPSHREAILHPDRRVIGVTTRVLPDHRYFVVGLLSDGRGR